MSNTENNCENCWSERIVILDGAMGTMIQSHKLDEQDFRGGHFANHRQRSEGLQRFAVHHSAGLDHEIHAEYLEAGADIVETNTFNSTSISMADYHLESLVYDLNLAGAQAAKRAVDRVMAKDAGAAPFCRRRHRPDQSDLFDLHRRATARRRAG